MYRRTLACVCLALLACSDDESGPDPIDGSLDARVEDAQDARPDTMLDAMVDSGPDGLLDAALDAHVEEEPYQPRTGYACELDQDYAFLHAAPPQGLATRWSYELERGGRFVSYADNNWKVPVPVVQCRTDLPACGSAKVDGSDLAAALTDPVVLAAFLAGEKLGDRNYFLEFWLITRADGKQLPIGRDCQESPTCVPVPAAARHLLNLLQRLTGESATDTDAGTIRTCRNLPL